MGEPMVDSEPHDEGIAEVAGNHVYRAVGQVEYPQHVEQEANPRDTSMNTAAT